MLYRGQTYSAEWLPLLLFITSQGLDLGADTNAVSELAHANLAEDICVDVEEDGTVDTVGCTAC